MPVYVIGAPSGYPIDKAAVERFSRLQRDGSAQQVIIKREAS